MEKSGRYIRLKIKEVLEDLDPEAIKAFLIRYAGNDRAFEMAFKSHFISQISTGGDESEKYRKVLEELIKPKNARNTIGPSQKKIINIVLKDFVMQMNDLLSTDNFTEAFYLIKESLEKIAYLQNRYNIKDKNIENCRLKLLSGLSLILDKQLAPAFRNKAESQLKELVSKSYYIPGSYNLIEVLNSKNVLVQDDKEVLIKDLMVKEINSDNPIEIIITMIQLCHPFERLARSLMQHFSQDRLFDALIRMIMEGKFEYVDFFIENPKVQFSYNSKLLEIYKYIEQDDHDALSDALRQIGTDSYSIIEIQKVCDALSDLYLRKDYDRIEKWIGTLPFQIAAKLIARANKNMVLLDLLKERNDVEWIRVFDSLLIERGFRKEVIQLYRNAVDDYISNHIGKKSMEYMEKLQNHLLSIGELNIYKQLYKHISETYGHRTTINK